MSVLDAFDLSGRVAIITGGAGTLGRRHAHAIAGAGGIAVLADIRAESLDVGSPEFIGEYGPSAYAAHVDITDVASVQSLLDDVLSRYGRVDILINNAANNPKVGDQGAGVEFSRLESFPLAQWEADIAVGLTGAFICSRIIGAEMAGRGRGVIVNIASDLSMISPDQRLYRRDELPDDQQPVKPVTYPVVKSGLLGLTRYLATYWADAGVRTNAISPGGVYTGQDEAFVSRLSGLVPLGRMARLDELEGAILFLCSDASSYMTGANLVVDGGRTVW